MRRAVLLACVAGCGRLGFDALDETLVDGRPIDTTGDAIVTLGPFGAWHSPVQQSLLNVVNTREFGTTISFDGLEAYYSSYKMPTLGGCDVWRATRPDRSSAFVTDERIIAVSETLDDGEPTIAADGLTMYLQRYMPTRLLVSTRPSTTSIAWSTPAIIPDLAGYDGADFGPPGDLRIVLQDGADFYEVTRPDTSSAWGTPKPLGIRMAAIEGYPSIRSDGLEMFWESNRTPPLHIWRATRASVDDPFGPPERLVLPPPLGSDNVGDPDISGDGRTLIVVSTANSSEFDVWTVERDPQ